MKAICEICGKEIEMPMGHRGMPLKTCSKFCKDEKRRQYQTERRQRLAGSKEPKVTKSPEADLSKAGWPPDTKKCQDCGKLFISESKSRVCPVCRSSREAKAEADRRVRQSKPVTMATPIKLKPLDDVLKEAKAAGYDPEDYGKYKTAQALAKAGGVDINLTPKKVEVEDVKYDIYQETGFEGNYDAPEKAEEETMGFKEVFKTIGIDFGEDKDQTAYPEREDFQEQAQAFSDGLKDSLKPELKIPETVNETPETGNESRETGNESRDPMDFINFFLPERPHRRHFMGDIDHLIGLMEKYDLDSEMIYSLSAHIMRVSIIAPDPFIYPPESPTDYLDPAWGFDRKARL